MTSTAIDSTLCSSLRISRGAFTLDIALDAEPGDVVALLGPNGAGKTTALRSLAGLAALDKGQIAIGDQVLDDPARGIWVPTERRPIAMVFQSYLLFENLSALDNIAFGLRARGWRKAAARAQAVQWLESFGLAAQARQRPRALSGGQAQRVALARALITDPRLLLLDEPLAALDASTRIAMRSELIRRLGAFNGVTVLVTHDPLDAISLANKVIVIEDGRIVQSGSPRQIARYPKTAYVATLVGLNLLHGDADGSAIALDGGGTLVCAGSFHGPVSVALTPSAISLFSQAPHGSPRNVWPGRVASLEQRAEAVRVAIDGAPEVVVDVTPEAVSDLGLAPGIAVWCAVKATELSVYPR